MSDDFTEEELDRIIHYLEQVNASLDNIFSLSDEMSDISLSLDKLGK